MNKSPDAFRTISEVAEDLDIPQHVLRFWETRFTSIRPLKRGGGRRYYRPDDVELLRGIRQLLYGQGYTIKGVQRILKEDGLRIVQEIGRGEHAGPPARPPPSDGADEQDGEAEVAAEEDGDDGDPPPAWSAPRTVSPRQEAAPVSGALARAGSAVADRDRLRTALDELLECRRILATLRRG